MISAMPEARWACGFSGSNGLLLVTRDRLDFVTDRRYVEQAANEVVGAKVHTPGYDLIGYIASEGLLDGVRSVLVQSDELTVSEAGNLRERMPDIDWCAEANLLGPIVAGKEGAEIDRIRAAQSITDAVFQEVLGVIRPGISERDVAAELVYRQMKLGAERMAFEPIVASGPRGALPHARASKKAMAAGELVVLDFGCVVDGYASDMTRTVALGDPGEEARRVYEIVLEAQEKAIHAARAGLLSSELDGCAREVIDAADFGEYFAHSLGHGVGLRTHEWPPVSFRSDVVLPENAAVTIEPGVYLPDRFGVRIEDIVVLRKGGCENLTRSPKQLIIL